MHSFRPSRARILFEVFCVLALSASLGVAWVQTGASALLGATAGAALFGLSHAFGMRRGPTVATEPQRIGFAEENPECSLAEPIVVEPAAAEEEPDLAPAPAEAEVVAIAPAVESKPGRSKVSRKPRAARKAAKEPEIAQPEPVEAIDVVVPISFDELDQPRIEPLFEPEPFVRQPRAVVFGRKAG